MAKRTATNELNHVNWNEEYEPEDAGTFKKAAEDVLEKRVIKAAKRRLPTKEGNGKSAFGTFAGFNTISGANPSPFSFLASSNTSSTTSSSATVNTNPCNSTASGKTPQSPKNGMDKRKESFKSQSSPSVSVTHQNTPLQEGEKIFKKSSDYYAKLKGLNEGVAQWIKTHVDTNPFCILTPIFRDYERYLKEIESNDGNELALSKDTEEQTQPASKDELIKESNNTQSNVLSHNSLAFTTSTLKGSAEVKPEKSIFSSLGTSTNIFGSTEQKGDSAKSVFGKTDHATDAPKSIFGNIETRSDGKSVFGNSNSESNPFLSKSPAPSEGKLGDGESKHFAKTATAPFSQPSNLNTATFSFGQSSSSGASAGFSFGSAKPFSFAVQAVKTQDTDDKTEQDAKDDEDDDPPKPDFKPVTEEGAVYEQRCKVFIKKDGAFNNRGIGTLFLKPTPNGKTQLIVRADTALGTILINTLLTESIPTKRLNKNNVMIFCLPMPDSQPPPVPVLLQVKTDEAADKLLETLNKHKK